MNSSSTLQTGNWRRSKLRDRERWQPRSFLVLLHHHPAEILYHPKLCCCIALTEETWRIQKYHVMRCGSNCGSIWKSWIPLWIQLWIQSPKHGYNCGSICKWSTTTATQCFKQKGSQIQAPGYNCGFNLQNMDTILDPSAKYQQQQQQQHNVFKKMGSQISETWI